MSALGIDHGGIHIDEIRCKCPIHAGSDNNTAFSYNAKIKKWRCFTAHCHEDYTDNIFGLTQAVLSQSQNKEVGFVEAVSWLANILGVDVSYDNGTVDEGKLEITRLINQAKLKKSIGEKLSIKQNKDRFDPFPVSAIKDRIKVSEYFLKQGFTEKTLKKFMIGECYDRTKPMCNRAFAPILDDEGNMVVGASGRILLPSCEICGKYHVEGRGCPDDNPDVKSYPKWLHYGFSSAAVLGNFSNARDAIRRSSVAIITEGPKDVWWFDQFGAENSCCIFGLNVSQAHIKKLLQAGARTLVFALDNDERGLKAMEKLSGTLELYFKLIYLNKFLKEGQDIADISEIDMTNKVVPFLKSLEQVNVK